MSLKNNMWGGRDGQKDRGRDKRQRGRLKRQVLNTYKDHSISPEEEGWSCGFQSTVGYTLGLLPLLLEKKRGGWERERSLNE